MSSNIETPEDPKVVDMSGKAVTMSADTSKELYEALEWARSNFAGEKHSGVAIVIVDHMGRVGTHHFWEAGFAHPVISGASLLLKRAQDRFEKSSAVET